MSALVLALVGPQVDSVAAASIGLLDGGIEHHPADALTPSVGKNVDQAQEPRSRNHITPSARVAEGVDERHRNGFTAVAADEKPSGVVKSGVAEARRHLSDASWPGWPIALTTSQDRALIDRHGVVHTAQVAEPHVDVDHTGLPARSPRLSLVIFIELLVA